MQIVSKPGHYAFQSTGGEDTCGVYIVGAQDEVIQVDFEAIDVSCKPKGLVVVSASLYTGVNFAL